MTELVVDASVLAFALTGKTPAAAGVRARLQRTVCHAPHLIDAEVGNVLRRRALAEDITPDQGRSALGAARDIIDVRYPHAGALAQLAWTWRDNLSFYDALYVALAACLSTPLVTGDARLSRAPALHCSIELV